VVHEQLRPRETRRTWQPDAWVALLLLLLLPIVASPLLYAEWYYPHERMQPVDRVIATAYEIEGGAWYPRWLSLANYGKGSPVLNFYPPAFYLAAAYLYSFGVPLLVAMKAILAGFFFVGAWGMYLWARVRSQTGGAALAAVIYLFVPYHLVNIYTRGAMAEFAALALLPFLFLGVDLSLSPQSWRRGWLVLAGTTATIIVTHHLVTIMIIPFAATYFLWRCHETRATLWHGVAAGTAPVLGAMLAAFYWLPSLVERSHLSQDLAIAVTGGAYALGLHFVYPTQWLWPTWGLGDSVSGPVDGMSFQVGWILLFFCAKSALTLRSRRKIERDFTVVTLGLGLAGLLLTTETAAYLYEIVPGWGYIQFPWRFLGVSTLFLCVGTATLGNHFVGTRRSTRVAVYVFIGTSLLLTSPQFVVRTVDIVRFQVESAVPTRSTEERVSLVLDDLFPAGSASSWAASRMATRSVGRIDSANEFLPRWANAQRAPLPVASSSAAQFAADTRRLRVGSKVPVSTAGDVTDISMGPSKLSFMVETPAEAEITIPWFYFPGWELTVDGQPCAVRPDAAGFIALSVPAGAHFVTLHYGTTNVRRLAWAISATALFGATLCHLWLYKRSQADPSTTESVIGPLPT
jgi:6-pyruvoyl-tetrahydropterin synthase related domain